MEVALGCSTLPCFHEINNMLAVNDLDVGFTRHYDEDAAWWSFYVKSEYPRLHGTGNVSGIFIFIIHVKRHIRNFVFFRNTGKKLNIWCM